MCLLFDVSTVLDFHNLHQMSLVLSEAGLVSDAAFTVKEHFLTTPGLSSLPEVRTHNTIYILHTYNSLPKVHVGTYNYCS